MAFAFAYQNGSGGGGVADNIYTADGTLEADRTATMGGFFLKFQDSSISLEMGESFADGTPGGFWGVFPNWPDINNDGTEFGFYYSPDYWGGIDMVAGKSTIELSNGYMSVSVYDTNENSSINVYDNLIEIRTDYAPNSAYASIRYDVGAAINQIILRAADSSTSQDAYFQIGNNTCQINAQGYTEFASGNYGAVKISQVDQRIDIIARNAGVDACDLRLYSDGNTVLNGENTGGDFAVLGYKNIAINANDTISIQAVNNIDLGCDSLTFGLASTDLFQVQADTILFNGGSNFLKAGTGSPEGVVTGNVGSLYVRENGGAGTTLYVKESGSGNTGWVAK